ncbi:MAG: AMP-binding protein [Candidatus Altiarchaeia archaeon]
MNFAQYLLEKNNMPEKDFVVGSKETISYGELRKKTDDLAGYLHKKLGEGNEIILLSENNAFFIISYLAIIKSGNTALLLETRIPEKDLKYILDICSVKAAFIQEKFKTKLADVFSGRESENGIYTESMLHELKREIPRNVDANDDDPAVIIFTSGSTGTKKGVILTHKNLRTNTNSIIQYLTLTEKDRIEAVLPFFYSYGLSLLNTHLRAGGSIVINHGIFLGSVISEIKKYECTGFAGVPSTYQILIEKTDFLKHDFPSIRYFTQAGGKLSNKFISEIADAFPDKEVYIMYGATEATARLSYLLPEMLRKKLGSIGKGIPGVTLQVVDANGSQVKPGVVGEIIAIGDNIMKGYYKDPELTKKTIKNGALYTGDLAVVDEDGYIYTVGRSSNIIKSAGYRISPTEIEEEINKLEGVIDCVAFGFPDSIMGECVTAAVLTKNASSELKETILLHCKKTFPSHKVPKHIVFMEEFPLNSSGKTNSQKIKETAKERIEKES